MSYQSKTNLYQHRRFNDLFNDTLVFVFRNILPITKVMMVFVGPMTLLYGTVLGLFSYGTINSNTFPNPNTPFQPEYWDLLIGGAGITSLVLAGLTLTSFYLTINSFILRYGESTDGRVAIRDVWEDIKGNYLHFLGLGIIRGGGYFLIVGTAAWLADLSFILLPDFLAMILIFVFIYLAVSTSLADILRMNEGVSVMAALRDSFKLVNKRWWATLGLYLLLGIVNILILAVITAFIGAMIGSIGSSVIATIIGGLIAAVIIIALSSSFMAMFWIAGALQYFNLSAAPGRGSFTEDLIDQIGKTQEDSLI